MGTLSKALPKSILKAWNSLAYGNHYVCSASILHNSFFFPPLSKAFSFWGPTFTIFYKNRLAASKAQKQARGG